MMKRNGERVTYSKPKKKMHSVTIYEDPLTETKPEGQFRGTVGTAVVDCIYNGRPYVFGYFYDRDESVQRWHLIPDGMIADGAPVKPGDHVVFRRARNLWEVV